MVAQHKSHLKDIQMTEATICYYQQVLARWSHQSMAQIILWSLESMPITRLKHQVSTYSARQTLEHSQLQKFLLLGSNREVTDARDHLRWTVRTSTRVRLCTRRSVFADTSKWYSTVYNVASVPDFSSYSLSQWPISRPSGRIGNKCDKQ